MTAAAQARTSNFNPRIPYGMRRHSQKGHPQPHQISIHASRMGCDLACFSFCFLPWLFQSTHPVWDATRLVFGLMIGFDIFQSTHPVWDATYMSFQIHKIFRISIHASRMGCDRRRDCSKAIFFYFNPRIPYGMRQGPATRTVSLSYFNPRIPYGMRL